MNPRLLWALRLLLWTAGAVLLTWPVARAPHALAVGTAEVYQGLWTGWALGARVGSGFPWLTGTTALLWPLGTVTISPSPLADLLRAPLGPLLGPVATWNLTLLAHVLVAGVGGSWLGGRLRLGAAGCSLAGSVAAFSPYLWSAGAATGAIEVFAAAFLPWVFGCAVELARRPALAPAAGLVLSWWLCGVGDAHLAVLLPLLLPVVLVPALRESWAIGPSRRAALPLAAAALLAALLLTGATLQPLVRVLSDPLARLPVGTLGNRGLPTPAALDAVATGSLTGGLLPGGGALQQLGAGRGHVLTVYAGWVALCLAVLGVGAGRLRWAALGVAAGLVLMGPYLFLEPQIGRQAPTRLWWFLHQHWAGFDQLAIPARATGFATVALAVLAGAGLDRLLHTTFRAAAPAGAGLVVGLLVLADTALLSPVPLPVPSTRISTSAAAVALAALAEPGAVLTLPRDDEARTGSRGHGGRWLTDQALHRRPLLWDLHPDPTPLRLESNALIVAVDDAARGSAAPHPDPTGLEQLPLSTAAEALADMGVRFVVLYADEVAPARRPDVQALLDAHATPLGAWADGSALYRLEPGAAGGS